jgi:hypothetical protein
MERYSYVFGGRRAFLCSGYGPARIDGIREAAAGRGRTMSRGNIVRAVSWMRDFAVRRL